MLFILCCKSEMRWRLNLVFCQVLLTCLFFKPGRNQRTSVIFSVRHLVMQVWSVFSTLSASDLWWLEYFHFVFVLSSSSVNCLNPCGDMEIGSSSSSDDHLPDRLDLRQLADAGPWLRSGLGHSHDWATYDQRCRRLDLSSLAGDVWRCQIHRRMDGRRHANRALSDDEKSPSGAGLLQRLLCQGILFWSCYGGSVT